MDEHLSCAEENEIYREEHEARMAFASERRDRIYRLHQEGMSAQQIARSVGGLAPHRVRKIIAWAEREKKR